MTTTPEAPAKFFGEDDDSWNLDSDGKIGISHFGNAVQVWAVQQCRAVSVAEAAAAFNCDPRMIVEAVEWHSWMDTGGPPGDYSKWEIYHDGE